MDIGTASATWYNKVPHKELRLPTYRSVVLDWPQRDTGGSCLLILKQKYGSSPDKEKYEKTFRFYSERRS